MAIKNTVKLLSTKDQKPADFPYVHRVFPATAEVHLPEWTSTD